MIIYFIRDHFKVNLDNHIVIYVRKELIKISMGLINVWIANQEHLPMNRVKLYAIYAK